jgi:hypothetical protein
MILGMPIATFTLIHVIISLAAILSGLLVVVGMLRGRMLRRWTMIFLGTSIATSATGFLFPPEALDPAIIIGVLSIALLTIALWTLYMRHLRGASRWLFVASSVAALYLNVFVGIAQAFQKIPSLKVAAPTGAEPPFLIAQLIVLVLFACLCIVALRRFPFPRGGAALY